MTDSDGDQVQALQRRKASQPAQAHAQSQQPEALPSSLSSSMLASPLVAADTTALNSVRTLQPGVAAARPAVASRKSEPTRPGTASSVGSYTSARFYDADEASPSKRAALLPTIASRSTLLPTRSNELTPASPSGSLRSLDSESRRSLASTSSSSGLRTKRDILASAASLTPSDDSHSPTSSRSTAQAAGSDRGSDADGGSSHAHGSQYTARLARPSSSSSSSSPRSRAERSRSQQAGQRSPLGARRRPPALLQSTISSSTHGSTNFTTPPSGGASPATPTISLPVHPLRRPRSDDMSSDTAEDIVDGAAAERDGARTPNGRELATPSASGPSALDFVDREQDKQPKELGEHDAAFSNVTPKASSTAVFASPLTQPPIPDVAASGKRTPSIHHSPTSERQSGGAFRERLRKTGGFLRRLGSSNNTPTQNSENSTDKAGSDSKTMKSNGLLSSRKSVLRKASQASFVTDDEGDETTTGPWTPQKTNVPVPSIPAQYRNQTLPTESSTSTLKSQADKLGVTQPAALAPSPSMEINTSLRAWEKEMDAELDKTAQNLDEITKIQAPRGNWTPSPQLPDYRRVLNRKGSFMDEGEATDENGGQDGTSRTFSPPNRASYTSAPLRRASDSNARETESISYESHFLSPAGHRLGEGGNNSRRVTAPTLHSAPAHRAPLTEPLRTTARFAKAQTASSDDEEEYVRTRDDNVSTATVRSFQTAIDRPSLFLRHARQEENDEQRGATSPFASDKTTDYSIVSPKTASPLPSPGSGPETSVRLVTPKLTDSGETELSPTYEDAPVSPSTTLPLLDAAATSTHAKGDAGPEVPDKDEAKAMELAEMCWREDESFKRREKIAEWLGGHGAINRRTRAFYFSNFDFAGHSVDGALRKLCDKLFLRAETQQVDRILSAFSLRYFACNPKTKLGSADIVHALTFSILLLNTDLHVAELTERMTRTQFVRNTIDGILESDDGETSSIAKTGSGRAAWEAHMETVLRDIYNAVKSDRIRLPSTDAEKLNAVNATRTLRQTGVNALKRGSIRGIQGLMGSGMSSGSRLRSDEAGVLDGSALDASLKRDGGSSMERFGRNSTSSRASSSTAATAAASVRHAATTMGFANTLSKSIVKEAQEEQEKNDARSIDSFKEELTDEELALLGPPWAKEGMLTRKHYWESAARRSKDKSWVECFTVIQRGQLSMFKFGSSTTSNGTLKQNSPAVGGGNWLSNATCIGQFTLAHSLSNILPSPGYNRARPHVFALTLSTGSVYFFQTAHEELAQEWAATCNYWAARLSREPLAAGVSNMEYGWNRVLSKGTSGGARTMDSVPASASRRSLASSLGEEEYLTNSTFVDLNASPRPPLPTPQKKHSSDTRSIRSGRSTRSTKSSRLRSTTTTSLFQNWNSGNSLDRIVNGAGNSSNGNAANGNGNQSGASSPVTSVISLSTPGTSIATTFDRPMIVHEWRPPVAPSMPSTLNEEEQLDACVRHTMRIERELEQHNSLRQPMMQLFGSRTVGRGYGGSNKNGTASMVSLSPPKTNASLASPSSVYGSGADSANASTTAFGSGSGGSGGLVSSQAMINKALSNWERRSAYLLSELTKFQLYVDSLRSASRVRAEKTDERELSRMMRRADEDLRHLGPDAAAAKSSNM